MVQVVRVVQVVQVVRVAACAWQCADRARTVRRGVQHRVLARASNIAAASIVRLCRGAGHTGWR